MLTPTESGANMEENNNGQYRRENIGIIIGNLEAKVESLERELSSARRDIRDIRDTITGVKGSWKALLAVGSILSGILITVAMKMFDFWAKK